MVPLMVGVNTQLTGFFTWLMLKRRMMPNIDDRVRFIRIAGMCFFIRLNLMMMV